MENNAKKKSINTVIYLLLAAMLVAVVGVSVFTVSSRRRGENPDAGGSMSDSLDSAGDTTKAPMNDGNKPSDTSKPSTSAPDSSSAPSTTEPDKGKANPTSKDNEKDVPAGSNLRYFVMPVVGTVAKNFEIDIPVYSLTMNDYRAHTGVDIAASLGDEVVAASSGTVCKIWNDPMMGRCVTIDHGDEIYTTYMNLAEESAAELEVGARLSMGQSIGAIGESALIEIAEEPHLHLEMKVNGKYVDPLEYMGITPEQDMAYED